MTKQQEGIVLEVSGRMAKVKTSRHNDCENCGSCPGNSAIVLEAGNPLEAQPGQRVLVEVKEVNMLKAAFVVYILPLIAAFTGVVLVALAAEKFAQPVVIFQIFGGVAAFIVAVGYVKYYDCSARSDEKMQPIIVEIIK